ncbi:MAG: molybdate ABC transporter substrate-binding protein [Nitrospirota bacterium]
MKGVGAVTSLLVVISLAIPARADQVTAAVAANFLPAFRSIAIEFERATGHRVQAIPGSSGRFYGQIRNGAPFDVFFSADQKRPQRLEDEGFAVRGSRFTYAIGRLVLWSPDSALVSGATTLRSGRFKYVAMANPQLAPYGAAAQQVMMNLGLWNQLQPHIVRGESLGQTMGFITSGNAQMGFVALSQVVNSAMNPGGSRWEIPFDLYDPIDQDAVLLAKGRSNVAAGALLEYVRGHDARRIIERFGYGLK